MQERVRRLKPDAEGKWGTLTAHRMLCHLQDQMEWGLSLRPGCQESAPGPPMFIRHILRKYLPIPKGKVKTAPGMLSAQPEEWEKEKTRVIELMDMFIGKKDEEAWAFHPFFGQLSGDAWARVTWKHNHHHLSQFSV